MTSDIIISSLYESPRFLPFRIGWKMGAMQMFNPRRTCSKRWRYAFVLPAMRFAVWAGAALVGALVTSVLIGATVRQASHIFAMSIA